MSAQLEEFWSAGWKIDRSRHQELCQHIRRLIQEHSLDLANGRNVRQDILDEALRNVWILEQATVHS
jgi:hypothetical protein